MSNCFTFLFHCSCMPIYIRINIITTSGPISKCTALQKFHSANICKFTGIAWNIPNILRASMKNLRDRWRINRFIKRAFSYFHFDNPCNINNSQSAEPPTSAIRSLETLLQHDNFSFFRSLHYLYNTKKIHRCQPLIFSDISVTYKHHFWIDIDNWFIFNLDSY